LWFFEHDQGGSVVPSERWAQTGGVCVRGLYGNQRGAPANGRSKDGYDGAVELGCAEKLSMTTSLEESMLRAVEVDIAKIGELMRAAVLRGHVVQTDFRTGKDASCGFVVCVQSGPAKP
jgi:hypothetical protein